MSIKPDLNKIVEDLFKKIGQIEGSQIKALETEVYVNIDSHWLTICIRIEPFDLINDEESILKQAEIIKKNREYKEKNESR
ncbi:MAG TPA: hypothetical protein VGB37_00355 [Candidatus Lokiarchaeia archaeon]